MRHIPHAPMALLCLVVLISTVLAANSAERKNIGTLTCGATTTKSVTKPVLRKLSCSFERFGSDARETYEGKIIHRGPNVTMRSEEILVWNVWRTGDASKPRSLLGKYFGLREDDPTRPGLGANTLVGGTDRVLLLEPIVNPGTGKSSDAVLSVVELELKPARI